MTSSPPTTPSSAAGAGLEDGGPVVVGIDGSAEAHRALLFAAGLAANLKVELLVVHAFGLVGSYGDWRLGVGERERQVREVMAQEWCAPLDAFEGLVWSSRCVQGGAVRGILRAAEEADAGFVVVGSHGADNNVSPFLGTTSQNVVRHSRRPVVVVPPDDDHQHGRGPIPEEPAVALGISADARPESQT